MPLDFTRNGDPGSCKRPIAFPPGASDCEGVPPPAKILIVDDDAEIRQLLGEELRDLGHESFYASDGLQALALVREERPDLILLDLRLPGGDGFSVLERLRHLAGVASTPVIVFSGMRSPDAEERALGLGAREFIHKSFSGNDLSNAIARALGRGPEPDASESAQAQPQRLRPPPPALRAVQVSP